MLFVDSVIKVPWQRQLRNRRTKSRMYFSPKGETVLENFLHGRHNRPYAAYRTLLPEVFKQLNVEPLKARWSQYAGCSCPCSPGFILSDMLSETGSAWDAYDVHVTVVEVTTIQQYAELVGVTYIGDVDPRCGGMFIAPRGEYDDHVNVVQIVDMNDKMGIQCLVALIGGCWQEDAIRLATERGWGTTDVELAKAVLLDGQWVDPLTPGHAFDDFRYSVTMPYDDVPDDDEAFMQLLIPFVDRILS